MFRLALVNILWSFGFIVLVNCDAVKDMKDSVVLKFVIQPTDVTVAEQSNVTLPCVAVSSCAITYTWTHNGTQLKLSAARYTVNKEDGNLTIINTSLNDAGQYRCIASNHIGSALSLKAKIRIAYLYSRSSLNNIITATEYSSVQFLINGVKSFPEAQFAWRVKIHGNSKLEKEIVDGENDGRLIISQSGDLYIVGVRSQDTGTYICVVSNPFVENDIIIKFVLTVLEGPVDRQLSFLLPPISTEATVGNPQVIFECIVATAVIGSSPQIPSITWYKNDEELNLDNNPKYSFPNGGILRHKLIINNIELNDSDWYSCTATTTSDVITSLSAQLTVNPKPAVPSFKAEFSPVISPSIGTDVTIDCHVLIGNCTWYKNAVKILSSSSGRLSTAANGSLLIHNVTEADSGLYQAFLATSREEISSPPMRLYVVGQPPLSPSVTTESLTTEGPSSCALTQPPTTGTPVTTARQSMTGTRVTTARQSTTGTSVTTAQKPTTGTSVTTEGQSTTGTGVKLTTDAYVTTNGPYWSTATLLYRKRTTADSAASFGNENEEKSPLLLYGGVGGAVVLLLIIILAVLGVFCFKTRSRRRLRKGSMKLKSAPDSEELEMKPVPPRNSSPARDISVRRLGNSNARRNVIQGEISLDANENHFITSRDFPDHVSAHENAALTRELAIVHTPRQQTTGVFQDEIRVLIEDEPDDLVYDSGIEEESSDSFQRASDHSGMEAGEGTVVGIPPYQLVNKTSNGQDETKTSGGKCLDTTKDEDVTRHGVEPLYHVLEGPISDCSGAIHGETGNEKPKTESFYQCLRPNYQGVPEENRSARNTDGGQDFPQEMISLSTGVYQSLTPPTHDVLNDEHSINSESGGSEKDATETSKGIYQPLLHKNRTHLQSHIDRPRSVTGIYQPLRGSLEGVAPFVRCASAPQSSQVQNTARTPGQDGTVDDEQRCPLNLDDPSSSFPRTGGSSPWASPLAQRRTIHEPTYVAVHVRPSRQSHRTWHSEHEPRYSPTPYRHSTAALQIPGSNSPRGHRRNFSDGGRVLSAMVNSSTIGISGSPVSSRPPSALPRHLGHRRNRSDIGLCPIDRSQENLSRRLTSTSDGGIPRTPSLGSLVTQCPRSASDTTHCSVHIGP